jgi:GTP-sensing pleiotropic transcriptional regulator CodY
MSQYPESDKLAARAVEYHDLHEFLDNLSSMNLILVDSEGDGFGRLFPTSRTNEQVVAQHLGIDLKKLDQERRQMLEEQREANG